MNYHFFGVSYIKSQRKLMIEFAFPKPKEQKMLIIFMHVFVIFFLIASQTLSILSIGSSVTLKGCLMYVLQIAIYFLCQYWVVPKMFDKRDLTDFFMRLCLLVFADVLIRGVITFSRSSGIGFWNFLLSFEQLVFALIQLSIVFGLSFFMGLYRRNEQLNQKYIKALQGMLEAETEKANIESIVTQMRLSPHLMFNTLSYIQMKADGVIPEICRAVDLFSGIVRHSMIDILEVKMVLLSQEIGKMKDQIELHRQLADGLVHIDFEEQYDGAVEDAMIPPATLLTFVENVFRYGLVKDPDYPASIRVKMDGRRFTFSTRNYKRGDPHHGTGMGIKSVASTLGYYYPGLHILNIENSEDIFYLTLTIQL